MIPYESLTKAQKDRICNGCGAKGGWIRPPCHIFFETSCDHHDYGYWKGCTEHDRTICDLNLLRAMKQDCEGLPWYKWIIYYPWCGLYFKAVKKHGKKHFHYGMRKRNPAVNYSD